MNKVALSSELRVVAYHCPYLSRRVAEIWGAELPVLSANAFLRSDALWTEATVEGKARRLLKLFRYLEKNDWSFWQPSVRLGGSKMELFRNSLLAEAHAGSIKVHYAKQVMHEVFALCRFWQGTSETGLVVREVLRDSRASFTHQQVLEERLPAPFAVKVPASERRSPHVMLPEEVERCWAYLLKGAVPKLPKTLRAYPLPPSNWTAERTHRWATVRLTYARQLAWYRRHYCLFAIALTSGMRLREIPLLMLGDVHLYHGELWVALRVRPQTKSLGRAKTGPRLMYVGFEPRVQSAWHSWLESRSVLVARWSEATGEADHGMLFVERNGAPMKAPSLTRLLRTLSKKLGSFGREVANDPGFILHPHALRHTIAALFDEWGVKPEVKQRHLGHRSASTTRHYGKTYRRTYVAMLDTMAVSILDGTEPEQTP